MSFTRGSLRTFLSVAKKTLRGAVGTQQKVSLVVGNESADLDSIASALLYAYIRSSSPSTHRKQPHATFHIPVINIPASDISIRPELIALLPYAGLKPEDLITLDDIALPASSSSSLTSKSGCERIYDHEDRNDARVPTQTTLSPTQITLTLVDHNAPTPPFSTLPPTNIIAVLDHHLDENIVPTTPSVSPRTITPQAGSCTSLIVAHLRTHWTDLSLSSSSSTPAGGQDDATVGTESVEMVRTWDAQIAYLALAAVLVDTSNLGDGSKTWDVDRKAVEVLEARVALAPVSVASSASTASAKSSADGAMTDRNGGGAYERDAFFAHVSAAKTDLDALTVRDCLRKDYKSWTVSASGRDEKGGRVVGISSVVKPLSWLVSKAGAETFDRERSVRNEERLAETVRAYTKERSLDVFAIMTAVVHDRDFKRELLLFPCTESTKGVVKGFEQKVGEKCGLVRHESEVEMVNGSGGDGLVGAKVWWQGNVGVSRKGVARMLREAVAKSTTP